MLKLTNPPRPRISLQGLMIGLLVIAVIAVSWPKFRSALTVLPAGNEVVQPSSSQTPLALASAAEHVTREYYPRGPLDTSGFGLAVSRIAPWKPDASLDQIADSWRGLSDHNIAKIDQALAEKNLPFQKRCSLLSTKASFLNYEGQPIKAYQALEEARALIEGNETLLQANLYSVIFFQGVTALRRGENENCILCRGESSCILPIAPTAVHTNPTGSRLAVQHFTEYLHQFPDDLEVRWLLNLAHMTLGEYPEKVDPQYLVSLDHFRNSEFDIGRFRDIGHAVGVNELDQAGGAIMEDFDNDGLLDIVVTCFDPTEPMAFHRNSGAGTFEEMSASAGITGQLGGLNCMQTDYNNDGFMDIFIVRGAWIATPVRPTLLRNNRDGTFKDVTREAGLLHPVNSIAASWADYDNDGWLDLFVCCERQQSRLYHNQKDGTFREIAESAGIRGTSRCKGSAWIDFDNDGDRDLFLNYLTDERRPDLYRNNGDGTFSELGTSLGIYGPIGGFSCWAWDYDNDGWEDIFATCYDRSLGDVVQGLLGEPHTRKSNCLYRNLQGRGFEDVTKQAGLDVVLATMGSNFGDFDNDGFLDMYLGTGDPLFSTLIPNRMFKNVGGKRFADITASSGTGNLQKGHGVACGDWDRDGNIDIFIEMGGAVNGDKYHNILFQNPGSKNHWLTVKLIGEKTNRAAIGARIKVVTAGEDPLTVHRTVSSGSSFGANPLQQTIGL
ncbi:MAG: VCBS repeat-containing protein, partial [Pirellulaceae bacterium]|nr:VCBS repeat-containing protein [Pirellulaceae bacterium]